ncbi:PrkA family serine protein kinase [Salinarchaeum chitinilyticum]
MSGEEYVEAADRSLAAAYEPPTSLAEYVDRVLEEPGVAAHAAKYLVDAIEAAGTRTVIERGEEFERYRFFDDPHNDGEHAILGNTATLNALVDDLRSIAAGRGKREKIVWIEGPTATGKSELKRCLVNGLREYSKTDAGRRYTIEWNVQGTGDARGLSYGDEEPADEDDWHQSPVQTHPLAVFPEDVREDVVAAINDAHDDHVPIRVETDLDPFSREAYEYLEERYRRQGVEDLFSAITDPDHLRVKNYVVDIGQGIGILHAEDTGGPKERLVGSWMAGMLQELDSRGRKNPQAFSYDGVLAQGNGLVTIVEDAAQHADLLQKLLSVPDEGRVKLDKGIGMDLDTQLLVISNPDLEATLNQHAERADADPLKALKRRLDRHDFTYLTNISLEAQLVRRELTGEHEVWTRDDAEARGERVRAPATLSVRGSGSIAASGEDAIASVDGAAGTTVKTATGRESDDGNGHDPASVREIELAPHAIEAAATFSVLTRLADEEGNSADLDLVEKALLFDQGYLTEGDERVGIEAFDVDGARDGRHGIPVTFTRDVLAELLQADRDRHHPDLPVEDVVLPEDVLDAMVAGLEIAPVFSPKERTEFASRADPVRKRIRERQAEDVIAAITADRSVDADAVEEYVRHVYGWATGEPIENDRGERIQPDPLTMKVFEIESLGRFVEGDYAGNEASDEVAQFRQEQVVTALNRHAWEHRGEDFAVDDVDLTAIPVIADVLETADWDDVRRRHEEFDPSQWADPPGSTETAAVKERAIEHMVEAQQYSPASAELTSRRVMASVADDWADSDRDAGGGRGTDDGPADRRGGRDGGA